MGSKLVLRFAISAIVFSTAAVAVPRPPVSSRSLGPVEVRATDDAWGAAEVRGDANFLDRLLLPEYQSVGSDGKVTTKASIVAHARSRGPSSELAAQVSAWKASHPTHSEVLITGDTAVLTWASSKPGSTGAITSSDVFVHRADGWKALYSRHTAASN